MQNKKLKIIGLTGGIAAGKSTVSSYLRKHGGYIFDCDKIAHNVILKGNSAYDEITGSIKGDYLMPNGQIDRKKLGKIVFHDSDMLNILEAVVHSSVSQVIKRKTPLVDCRKYRFIVIDAPLLLQSSIKVLCDTIWIVDAPVSIRANRIMERNKFSLDEALYRINIQIWESVDIGKYVVIDNKSGIKELNKEVKTKLNDFLNAEN